MSKRQPVPPMFYQDDFVEHMNIAWRVEQAELDPNNPLIEPKYPWDSASACFGHGTVLKDPIDGKYKAWVCAMEDEEPAEWQYSRPSEEIFPRSFLRYPMRLAYYVSDDGVNWERPMMKQGGPFEGYPESNIVFPDACGRSTMASVLIEPELNPEEPYEMFIFQDVVGLGVNGDTVPGFDKPGYGLFRYRSKDGMSWRPAGDPIDFLADGDGLFVYRQKDGAYRMHHKVGWPMGIPGGMVPYDCYDGGYRMIYERLSQDGTNWSEKIPVGIPNWKDNPTEQYIDLGYHPYGDGVIGIANMYCSISQTFHPRFAASRDGKKWWRPSDRACMPILPVGDIGGGLIWSTRELIEDGDRVYFYYGGTEGLHGDVYARSGTLFTYYGGMCRASWEKGRMWAAVPATGGPVEARLTTPMVDCAGKFVRLNAVTVKDGEVQVELLDEQKKAIPGYTREEFVTFRGDDKLAVCAWKRGSGIDVQKAHVRLYFKRARIYGAALEDCE